MRIILLFVSFLLTCFTHSQILVSKAGDGWDKQVDSAINLIKTTDPDKFQVLKLVCDKVDFWIGNHSTCFYEDKKGTIIIAVKDIELNSINNLAAILVHESLHLTIMMNNKQMPVNEEEYLCYRYELSFISKLQNPEYWLLEHIKTQIQNNIK